MPQATTWPHEMRAPPDRGTPAGGLRCGSLGLDLPAARPVDAQALARAHSQREEHSHCGSDAFNMPTCMSVPDTPIGVGLFLETTSLSFGTATDQAPGLSLDPWSSLQRPSASQQGPFAHTAATKICPRFFSSAEAAPSAQEPPQQRNALVPAQQQQQQQQQPTASMSSAEQHPRWGPSSIPRHQPSVTALLQQLPTCSIYNPLSHVGSNRLQPGAALAASNSLMAAASLPVRSGAGVKFDPVCSSSILFRLGTTWGFPAFSLCLGSSYFQRVMDGSPALQQVAALAGAGPRTYTGPAPAAPLGQLLEHILCESSAIKATLFTCVMIAAKVVGQVPHPRILPFMLSELSDEEVSSLEANNVGP
ncbi:hypothetical protein FOA52_008268 [Chlamydomonas sp. UWO 241]|nr:hypothetical protein FOA52_008268 [Chlamydomonas sp. UWO 241]